MSLKSYVYHMQKTHKHSSIGSGEVYLIEGEEESERQDKAAFLRPSKHSVSLLSKAILPRSPPLLPIWK